MARIGLPILFASALVTSRLFVVVCSAQSRPVIPAERFLNRPLAVHIHNASLAEMARSLGKNGRFNLLIDGEPLRQHGDVDSDGTLREALDRVADAFDYSWAVGKSGAVLMTKRFRNPRERPQIHLAELRQAAKDVLDALNQVQSDGDASRSTALLVDLARSMTKEQADALREGQILHGSDLAPAQLQMLTQAALIITFAGPYRVWDELYSKLRGLPKSFITAKRLVDVGTDTAAKPRYNIFHIVHDPHGSLLATQLMLFASGSETKGRQIDRRGTP